MTWNPNMDDAPRDGTEIDLWVVFPNGGVRWADAKWLKEGEHSCTGPGNWCLNRIPLHAYTEKPTATHWMPLPAPPQRKD